MIVYKGPTSPKQSVGIHQSYVTDFERRIGQKPRLAGVVYRPNETPGNDTPNAYSEYVFKPTDKIMMCD